MKRAFEVNHPDLKFLGVHQSGNEPEFYVRTGYLILDRIKYRINEKENVVEELKGRIPRFKHWETVPESLPKERKYYGMTGC